MLSLEKNMQREETARSIREKGEKMHNFLFNPFTFQKKCDIIEAGRFPKGVYNNEIPYR